MKYFELVKNEYVLKNDIVSLNEVEFAGEVNDIKEHTNVMLDSAVTNLFITPIYILLWTLGAVIIASAIAIAFGILLETNLLYIPIGLAWAIWIFLVVIVIIDRDKKSKYLESPTILMGKIIERRITAKNYIIRYVINIENNESIHSITLKANSMFKREKNANIRFYEEHLKRDHILVIVYRERQAKYYPIKLFLKQ